MAMKIDIPLQKIDEEQRLVIGRATQEVVDKSGEIMDYELSKVNFKAWSNDFAKRTNGKSYGNLRQQHDSHKAIGKLVKPPSFNDDDKAIDICAKVVDDNAWELVKSGVLNAFSIGGSYGKQWFDDSDNFHYEAIPAEISLVDNPCCPTAVVEFFKTDGSIEYKKINKKECLKLDNEVKKALDDFKDSMLKAFDALEKSTNKEQVEEMAKADEPNKPVEDEKEVEKQEEAVEKADDNVEKSSDEPKDEVEKTVEKCDTVKNDGEVVTEDCFTACSKAMDSADDTVKENCNKLFHKMVEKQLYCKCDKCTKAIEGTVEKADADNVLHKADTEKAELTKDVESEKLAKAVELLSELQKGVDSLKADNEKLRKQVEKLENEPVVGGAIIGCGSVTMDKTVGTSTANKEFGEAEMLRKMRDEADSSVMKEAYSEQLAKLELKKMYK